MHLPLPFHRVQYPCLMLVRVHHLPSLFLSQLHQYSNNHLPWHHILDHHPRKGQDVVHNRLHRRLQQDNHLLHRSSKRSTNTPVDQRRSVSTSSSRKHSGATLPSNRTAHKRGGDCRPSLMSYFPGGRATTATRSFSKYASESKFVRA